VRCSHPVSVEQLGRVNDRDLIAYLRWRTYLPANRSNFRARTPQPKPMLNRQDALEPIAAACPVESLRAEISSLPPFRKLGEDDGLEAYIALASEAPNVVREIGRLRDQAFRAIGEGTGRQADLDRFDEYYWHLFLWNEARGESQAPTDLRKPISFCRGTGYVGCTLRHCSILARP